MFECFPRANFDDFIPDSMKANNPMADVIATMNEELQRKIEPPDYEDTMFARMAEDISKRFEPQISAATSMAENSKSIAESAKKEVVIHQELLDSYKTEIEDAKRDARHSQIVARISISIALASLLIDALQSAGFF